MKTLLLLCALVVGSVSSWADSYTITFKAGSGDGSNVSTSTACSAIVSDGASYLSGNVVTATYVYYNGSNGLKLGKSGGAGTIKMNLAASVASTTIVVNAKRYNTSKTVALSVNGGTSQAVSNSENFNDYTFTVNSNIGHIELQASQYCWIHSVTINYTPGSSTPTCATPTFSPAAGFYTSAQNVTISTATEGATIYYTTNGDDPTTSSSVYSGAINVSSTTTIKAMAAKANYDNSAVASATYTIYPVLHAGTALDPYTVADARNAIDANIGLTDVYVSGIVCMGGSNLSSGAMNYWISDDGTETDKLEAYRGKNLDDTNFTSTEDIKVGDVVVIYGSLTKFSSTYEFSAGNYLTSKIRKADSGLAAVDDEIQMEVTTERDATSLFTVTSDGAISYESSDPTIANVEGGKLKAFKPGEATITISVAQTAAYAAGNVDVEVTVTTKPATPAAGPAEMTSYSLVTDASTLVAGDKIVLVNEKNNKIMAGQNSNNRAEDNVTISEHAIASLPATAAVITLEGSSAGWNLKTEDGYLYAASSSGNYLRSRTPVGDDNAKATISITDNNAVITFQGTNTRNKIKHNNSSNLFSCYASAATADNDYVQIYRVDKANTYDVAIGSTGYKTLISSVGATLPAGLTAYIAVSAGEGKIHLTSVASIKAGSAYVLKGAASTNYTLTLTDTPEEPTGNILEVSTETTGNGVYVLANGTSGPGFYKWAGGALGAGRAIVPASAVSSSAREYLEFSFDNETTGLSEELRMKNEESAAAWYDLQGRKVAQPTKGLYIVNGKKVVIK